MILILFFFTICSVCLKTKSAKLFAKTSSEVWLLNLHVHSLWYWLKIIGWIMSVYWQVFYNAIASSSSLLRMGRVVPKILYYWFVHFDAFSWYSAAHIVHMKKTAFILIINSILEKSFYINMNANFMWQLFLAIGTTPLNTCILTWSSWSVVFPLSL